MAKLSIYITNLGKYNEGELLGEWVELPVSDEELDAVYDRIQICHDDKEYFDEAGNPYEEVFITDYECDVPGIQVGEYDSIENLNELAEKMDSMDEYDLKIFEAAVEAGYVDEGDIDNFDADDYWFLEGVGSDSDLGYEYIDQLYGGDLGELGKETIERYFDYEALGRDIRIEFNVYDWIDVDEDDEEEVARICDEYGVDDIEDIDAYKYFNASSDYLIGEEWVDQIGSISDAVSDPSNYFDYEAFGRDLSFDGSFTDNGFIFNRQ